SATAHVGTSYASLILPQAAGFGRCAAPPSSSANAALVCLGAAPAGPFFAGLPTMQGGLQRGQAPFVSSRKRGSRGRNPSERVSPSVHAFGYFLHEQKVTRGAGPEAP